MKKGVNTVNNPVNATPVPKVVTPPYLLHMKAPRGEVINPQENELKMTPFSFDDQLNSATYARPNFIKTVKSKFT